MGRVEEAFREVIRELNVVADEGEEVKPGVADSDGVFDYYEGIPTLPVQFQGETFYRLEAPLEAMVVGNVAALFTPEQVDGLGRLLRGNTPHNAALYLLVDGTVRRIGEGNRSEIVGREEDITPAVGAVAA